MDFLRKYSHFSTKLRTTKFREDQFPAAASITFSAVLVKTNSFKEEHSK